jgi:ATP-dependent RNA helicase RhlE
MKFESLKLHPLLLRAVATKGYSIATPIQADAIPPILAGRDLVGCAQTGTGKTAAFALPTLERLLESIAAERAAGGDNLPPSRGGARGGIGEQVPAAASNDAPLAQPLPAGERDNRSRRDRKDRNRTSSNPAARRKTRCLVLAPTRELAAQIADSFAAYGQYTALRRTVVYGGVSQNPQVKALEHGVDVLIATPGRLLDLMNQGHVDLKHVEALILDEADQMLDMGFIPDLRRIIARVPKKRQTLMFSATMPAPIRQLADEWLVDPVAVSTTPIATPAERVEQSVYFVEKQAKLPLLAKWLESTAASRTLVFARTKHGADKIVKHLSRSKIRAAAIHGNKSQNARERALEQFKSDRPPVLVATDIAARGLDVREVSHVVNFDLPAAPETYVHHIGRTGRAGASGIAVSFCSRDEAPQLRMIERLTRRQIEIAEDSADFQLPTEAPAGMAVAATSASGRSSGGRGGARGRRPTGARPGARPGARSGGQRPKPAQAGAAAAAPTGGATSIGGSGQKRRRRHSGRL